MRTELSPAELSTGKTWSLEFVVTIFAIHRYQLSDRHDFNCLCK